MRKPYSKGKLAARKELRNITAVKERTQRGNAAKKMFFEKARNSAN